MLFYPEQIFSFAVLIDVTNKKLNERNMDMKKTKRFLTVLFLAGMFALSACTEEESVASAPETPTTLLPPVETVVYEPEVDGMELVFQLANFVPVSGVITEIQLLYEPSDDRKEPGEYMVLVQSNDGSFANFHVDHLTGLFLDGELSVGMNVTGFFDSGLPMIMIYPPQYHARVLASGSFGSVFVDRFDADFLAHSLGFGLDINDSTEIMFQDGQSFDGDLSELENRILAVFSSTLLLDAGAQLPATITPSMIAILFERAVHPIHHLTEEELDGLDFGESLVADWGGGLLLTQEELDTMWDNMLDPETVQIILDGDVIDDAPTPFVDREHGMVMLPVAVIAEAMGMVVVGDGADVVIGAGITFVEGVDNYHFGRRAPQQLGVPPVVVDGVLFVPIIFFHEILSGSAYMMDGNIIIYSEIIN